MKKDIRAYGYDRLKEEMEALGEKPFRAKQVYEWLHVKLADDFDEMTNLSKALREKLKEEYVILPVKMLERQISQIDGTNKFLFQLYDGNVVESVLMRYKHGNSVCISSQAGCRMGCAFCASTIGGLQRNLSSSEMLISYRNPDIFLQVPKYLFLVRHKDGLPLPLRLHEADNVL